MTVRVSKSSRTIASGLLKLKDAMIADYNSFMPENEGMKAEFAEKWGITSGSKYIKVVEEGSGVKMFIVNTDTDKKFKKGDILKPAGWAAPARNKARGNILDGNYPINWTGPLYLK